MMSYSSYNKTTRLWTSDVHAYMLLGMCVRDSVDPPTLWVMAGNPQTLWVMTVSLGGLPKYHRSLGGNGVLPGQEQDCSKVEF